MPADARPPQAPLLYQLRDGEVTASEIDGLRSMGEADVKFVR